MTTPMNNPAAKTDKPADEDLTPPVGPRVGPFTDQERQDAKVKNNSPPELRS